MDAIIDALTSICDFIMSIIFFIRDMIEQTIQMIVMLGEAAITIPKLFSIFPPFLYVLLGTALSVAIAYKILGRD